MQISLLVVAHVIPIVASSVVKFNFAISHGQATLTTNRKGHNNSHRMHQGGTRGARSAPFWSVYVVAK